MYTKALVVELQWPGREGELSVDGHSECLCVRDNGFEVLDADYYMHILLHMEVLEVFCMYRDGCFEWLLQHFCFRVSTFHHFMHALRRPTFAILDLLGEARQHDFAFLGEYVELFRL